MDGSDWRATVEQRDVTEGTVIPGNFQKGHGTAPV